MCLVSQRADHRPGRRPAAAPLRGRRPALPEAARRTRARGADRAARRGAGGAADPRPRLGFAARPGGRRVRLHRLLAGPRGPPPGGPRRVLRDRRPEGPRARRRRPPALARSAHAAAPAGPGGAARADLSGAQDPGQRAVPLLVAPDSTERLSRFTTNLPRLRARAEMSVFLRRMAWLSVAIVA